MKQLVELTSDPKQQHTVVLEDGDSFTLQLSYLEQQRMWSYSIAYSDTFIMRNSRLVMSKNLLRQYKNILPFGIICEHISNADPFLIDDFSSNRAILYILTSDEVEQVEDNIYVGSAI
tara:strand:- start:8773 stop:9126 length:354 start_codon:yes stop_codon:yes gene_type:complete